ncbi:MarR family protein [Halobiforma haloterrestris]|uniref:MarR family protein n=1 Tax=Natronobacterium haloterrestre TaxID=148448 RepID=A0A1I1JBL7_NATHA|nr:helix-turn-helix domain-containing protein [Halobiforma haloterrestris]SFC42830.1 MarR family protein [Halobiforma haloterrestris]
MATDDHPTEPEPEPNRSSPDDRTLLETIADTEPTTIPELADGLGVHPATIERRCLELQRRGLVRQCTGGHLTVADSTADERSNANANANASLSPDGGSSEPVAGD